VGNERSRVIRVIGSARSEIGGVVNGGRYGAPARVHVAHKRHNDAFLKTRQWLVTTGLVAAPVHGVRMSPPPAVAT